jgi:hypothetical protein
MGTYLRNLNSAKAKKVSLNSGKKIAAGVLKNILNGRRI